MKNITLSADEKLIEAARREAMLRGSTLNEEFRQWLATRVVSSKEQANRYQQLMERLSHVNAGRKFTREEMNEH